MSGGLKIETDMCKRCTKRFMTVGLRSLRYVRVFAVANLSVVCNVRAPYSGGWNFPTIFLRHFVPISRPLTSVHAKFYGDRVPGVPLHWGVKHKRDSKKKNDVTFGYLISWWVSCTIRHRLHWTFGRNSNGQGPYLPCNARQNNGSNCIVSQKTCR